MKTKKSIWSIALILVLALALVLGLGFGASRAVVKADDEDIEHITFDVTVDNEESIVIGRNYDGYIVVRYTVAENTGVDALQLTLGYDHDVFALTRLAVLNNTALGAATVTNGTLDENNVDENYDSYIYENDIDANIVFDNTNTNGTTYTTTGDTLIVAYFARIATTPGVYDFGFADKNNKDNQNKFNGFSNAWRIEKSEEETSTHAHVELRERVATVIIRGDYEFTLTGGEKTYDGTAATVTLNDNNNENRPEISYVWFTKDSNENYVKLDNAPVSAGTYYVVIEYAANDYYDAYKGYTLEDEVYTLTDVEGKKATITINPRAISVLINNQTSAYGDAIVSPLTYAITSGEVLDGDVLGIEISTTATSSSNVGTYPITGAYLNRNYAVTFTKGTYTITKKSITITALDQSASYTGNEPIVDQTRYSVDPNIQITGVVITKAAGVNPGTYVLTPSFNNDNYNVTLVNGIFTITVSQLTQEQLDDFVAQNVIFYANDNDTNHEIAIANRAGSYGRNYNGNQIYVGVIVEGNSQFKNYVDYQLDLGSVERIQAIGMGNFADYNRTNAGTYVAYITFLPNDGYAFAQGVNATYTVTFTINKVALTITADGSVQYSDALNITVNNGEGWVNNESYSSSKYNTSLNEIKTYVGSTYVVGSNAGTTYNIAWVEGAEAAIEAKLFNYDVTLVGAQDKVVAKKVVNASDYTFAGYEGVYDGAEHGLAVGSAENINADFDIVDIDIIDKSSVKDVADTGAYTATITLKNPNNYTFENGNNDGWIVDENGYAEAEMTVQVTITAATLTIKVDYTKTTATFTLEGFVGDDTVADLTNLAYLADGANTNINGNVYTINGYVANAITVSATSNNTNYTITGKTLKNIVKVEYAAGQYDAEKAGMTPVLPETEVFFAGFTADEPQAVALNHYTFVRFATDANNTAAFDFTQAVNENKVVYAIWEVNEKYTLTLYYMVEGDVETLTKIAELQFYSDEAVNYNELPVVAQKAWFKVQKWFNEEALETKFVDGSKLSENTSVYANYKFNIGLGDVNANGKVNANDITLYRQWIVGGYTMQVVESGTEWATVNSQDFNAENTIYFVKRVADSNALTAESLELGDNHLDIRDVSTIRMGMVGGYGFSILEGKFVDGEELIVTRTVSANNASDLLILAKSGLAIELTEDINEPNFVAAIENAQKDIIIDLKGHTLTLKSFRVTLAEGNTGKILVTNGRINVSDGNGVYLTAVDGSVHLDNVTLYDDNGLFVIQTSNHSLHLFNVVRFLKQEIVDNEPVVAPAEVLVVKDTHIVVEGTADLEIAKVVVAEIVEVGNEEQVVPVAEDSDAEITITNNSQEVQTILVQDNKFSNAISNAAELVAAAAKGGEYKVIADFTVNQQVTIEKDFTLDGNNHTITFNKQDSNYYAFYVVSENVLSASFSNLNIVSAGYQVAIMTNLDAEGSLVNVNNVDITCDGECIYANGFGVVNANNCEFTRNGEYTTGKDSVYYSALTVGYAGTINATNCTVTSDRNGVSTFPSGGTINLTNVDVTVTANDASAIWARNEDYNVSGYEAYCLDSVITINGGNIVGGLKLTDKYTSGNKNYHEPRIVITGGTFDNDPTTYLAEGYYAEENNGVYTVKKGISNAEQLLAAVAEGGEYKVVADFEVNQQVTIEKDFTLDGNNHTITFNKQDSNYYAFYVIESNNNPTVANFSNLTIVSTGYQVAVMTNLDYANSGANLNNVDITCDGECVYANGYGVVNAVECDFTRNGEYATGKDSVYYSALTVGYAGTINATNCNIVSDRNAVSTFPSGGFITLENTNVTANGNGYAIWARNEDYNVKGYEAYCTDSVITINSGNIVGEFKITDKYTTGSNNYHEPRIVVNGGTFDHDPTTYLAEGYYAEENNGVYTVKAGITGSGQNPVNPPIDNPSFPF